MKNKFCSIGENEKCQISELIKKAIGLRKKSDFAQLIGISLPMMSRLVNGKYSKKIPIDILQKIYKNRYNQSDTTLLQQLYLLNGYEIDSIKQVHKMKNIEELFKAALEYHLQQIEDQMQEAVNKGNLSIQYHIPKLLFDEEGFRNALFDEFIKSNYHMKRNVNDDKNVFIISCIEIIDEEKKSKGIENENI